MTNRIVESISKPLTRAEESTDNLTERIGQSISSRLSPLEDRLKALEIRIQNELIGRYASLIPQMDDLEEKYPIKEDEDETSKEEQDDKTKLGEQIQEKPLYDSEQVKTYETPMKDRDVIKDKEKLKEDDKQRERHLDECIKVEICKPIPKDEDTKEQPPKLNLSFTWANVESSGDITEQEEITT
ncbi:MAG: hypothetical protein QXW38_09550 [Candidatus Nitrosotenuis sp.]